jgi:tRNA/tmRNA/rRNA uracil-C5-methylase (TrmA/RlmC/RlmD family)
MLLRIFHVAGKKRVGVEGTLDVLCGNRGQLHLSLHVLKGHIDIGALQPDTLQGAICGIHITEGKRAFSFGEKMVSLSMNESIPLMASAKAFAQPNPSGEQKICEILSRWSSSANTVGLELFAGIGTLTRTASYQKKSWHASEISPAATVCLKHNFRGDPGVTVLAAQTASAALKTSLGKHIDTLLLNPPREGARTLMPLLLQSAPMEIFYVSCDPLTFARDVFSLSPTSEHPGYVCTDIEGVDILPQTYRMEIVARLERVSALVKTHHA